MKKVIVGCIAFLISGSIFIEIGLIALGATLMGIGVFGSIVAPMIAEEIK